MPPIPIRKSFLILGAFSMLVATAVPATAQSAPELLEKGIYLEETVGRLDQAIEVYRRILCDATAHRAHVAEALYRLGLCHLEKGDTASSSAAFERLLAEYSEQEPFVERAREQLSSVADGLELLPAPWPEGEVLRMSLKLASGTPLGVFLVTADTTELDGDELWRLRVRQKVFSDADSQAIRQVLARRDTMAPVASFFRHSAVGHFDAKYADDRVTIDVVGSATPRRQKLDGPTFDSEELFHLLRRLPLELGYETTIRLISAVADGVTPVEIEVSGKEQVVVPAGEFECYRLKLSIPQIFWISTDASRVIVKFEASGIVSELQEVYVQEPGRENVYHDESLGLSVTLPPDWLHHLYANRVLFLLDPEAEAQTRLEIRRSQGDGDCTFQAAAYHKVAQAQTALADYTLRDGTWSEHDVGGWPAVSFVGDYRELDVDKVHYWTFIQNEWFCVDFTLKVAADRFEELRTVFDSIIASYEAPPPPPLGAEGTEPEVVAAVRSVIAEVQLGASAGEWERFFQHLARDAVFFGTDAADRFDVDQLGDRFDDVSGWMAGPSELRITVSDDQTLAWFDQRLASRRLGELRASGVLRFADGRWKIVQYHVGMPVPNELAAELVEKLRAHDEAVGRQPAEPAPPPDRSADDPAEGARDLLHGLRIAQAKAYIDRYFGSFAPEAVVLGTARTERLTVAELRALVGPDYARGYGRTSIPVEQHVYLSPAGNLAWFDELIERKHLGLMRSTGVMRKSDDAWKVVQFNRVIVVPNELAEDLARRIDTFYAPPEKGHEQVP